MTCRLVSHEPQGMLTEYGRLTTHINSDLKRLIVPSDSFEISECDARFEKTNDVIQAIREFYSS